MQEITTEALLAAVRAWVEIESPTQDAAAVNRMADHAAVLLRQAGARIERRGGRGGLADLLLGRIAGTEPGPVARHGIARFHLRATGVPAHAGAYHAKGRSAIREMARQVLAIEAMTDHSRNLTLNVGMISGDTHENMVPLACEARIYCLVPTPQDESVLRMRLAALSPHDPDVTLALTPGLSRPVYGKTPAIQALYDHAAAASGLRESLSRAAGRTGTSPARSTFPRSMASA